ncbi:MAG: transcriptional repressor LexA [bacterium]
MENLTKRQRQILNFVRRYVEREGLAPSQREIAAYFDIHLSAVQKHLESLAEEGVLVPLPGKARGIVLKSPERQGIPVLGAIPAGAPMEAVELADEILSLDPRIFGAGEVFALRVKGDSMLGDAIRDGDYAVIKFQAQVAPHEIAAVRVNHDEAALKRVRLLKGGEVELVSSNPEHPPRRFSAKEVAILGKFVGLLRVHRK